ncbi:LytR/AlgR family response regulator transcription factor [Rheinheimera tilapiae]|jgi:two-component system response regulator AlgR|uniref:LytR/AlgR family response regulator transcription factor n=1 Tax=Rheinheimera tilapiae TaxID=875043 RepID=A0ABV6BHE7_9GAMM
MRVLIVDDEPLARSRLSRLLAQIPGYQLVAEAENGAQALQLCTDLTPDLVFLDIEMPGADGLSVAADLARIQPPPAVIFVTAHPQHALAAYQVAPADYLLKPIGLAQLQLCLERLGVSTRVHLEKQKLQAPRLSFRVGLEQRSILLSELFYLQADDKYVRLVYQGGEALTETSLKQLQEKYPQQLVRIHRNTLVLAERICGISRSADGQHLLLLRDCPVQPEISRRELAQVRLLLQPD